MSEIRTFHQLSFEGDLKPLALIDLCESPAYHGVAP